MPNRKSNGIDVKESKEPGSILRLIDTLTAGPGRLVTPAGIVSIVLILLGIKSGIDRNCNATADLATVTGIVVSVDNELKSNSSERAIAKKLLEKIDVSCN